MLKVLCIFIIMVQTVFASTTFVDGSLTSDCITGNYSLSKRNCTGNDGNAYSTICKGIVNTDIGGGYVDIREGIYRQSKCSLSKAFICPCMIEPYLSEVVTVKPLDEPYVNNNYPLFDVSHGNYIFIGIEFDGEKTSNCVGDCQMPTSHDYHYALGSINGNQSNNITVINCNIHDFAHAGLKGLAHWNIRANQIYNIGYTRWDHAIYPHGYGQFQYNYIHDISGSGVHAYDGGTGTVGQWSIIYNIFRNGGTDVGGENDQSAILIQASNPKIYNNIIDTWRHGIVSYGSGNDFWEVKNNIIMNITNNDIEIENSDTFGANGSFINNILGSGICSGCNQSNTRVFDDVPPNISTLPTFTSEVTPLTWTDYKPTIGGSQVGAGVDLGNNYNKCISSSSTTWPPTLGTQGSNWNIGVFCN